MKKQRDVENSLGSLSKLQSLSNVALDELESLSTNNKKTTSNSIQNEAESNTLQKNNEEQNTFEIGFTIEETNNTQPTIGVRYLYLYI
jgi:hypothetical protein